MKKIIVPGHLPLLIFMVSHMTVSSQVSLVYNDTLTVISNSDFVLPVTLQTGHDISAISLGIIFPEKYPEITGMEMAGGTQGYSYSITDSLFQMAWSAVNPITIADNGLVISLGMKSKDLSDLDGTIRLELGATSEFADDSANIIDDIVLQIPEISLPAPPDTAGNNYVKVYPNPFKDIAVIEFYLESESLVKITLCNLAGQSLQAVTDRTYQEGLHQIRLSAVNFSKGTYLLKYEADDGTQSDSRLIKIIALPYISSGQ